MPEFQSRSSRFGLGLLELLALTGAAIAQPLLDQFGRAPDIFIQLGARRWELVVFALALAFVPALAIMSAEAVVALIVGERQRLWLHSAALALLATLFVVRTLRITIGWSGVGLLVASVALALLFECLRRVVGAIRQWLHFASILPLIAVVTFLAISPTSQLLEGGSARAAVPLASRSPLTVVIVAFDEFPELSLLAEDGAIDPVRFPHFAALARESRWFRNATSVGTHTYFANPAILTGRTPRSGYHAPTWVSYPDTLFRLLGASYATNASESVTQLCAPSYCRAPKPTPTTRKPKVVPRTRHDGLSALFAKAGQQYPQLVALHERNGVAEGAAGEDIPRATTTTTRPIKPVGKTSQTTPKVTRAIVARTLQSLAPVNQPNRFTTWLDQIQSPTTPVVHYLHLLLPHYPWHLTSSGLRYELPPKDADELLGNAAMRWNDDPEAAALGRRRHLLQVGYVDKLLGIMIAHLKKVGVWDRSVFVVTADHGAGFSAGGNLRELEPANTDDILGVPLFIRAPGLKTGTDDRPAQTIDIVPTIAQILGARVPWPIDGRSLVGPARPRSDTSLVGIGHNFSNHVELQRVDLGDHLQRTLALAALRAPDIEATRPDRSVLSTGPHGALIGSAINSFRKTRFSTTQRVRLAFTDRDEFEDIRPDQALPIYIVGDLTQSRPGDTVVAALNGIVAGTGAVIDQRSSARQFGLILDPTLLHAGRNHIAFYVLRNDGSLTPVQFG